MERACGPGEDNAPERISSRTRSRTRGARDEGAGFHQAGGMEAILVEGLLHCKVVSCNRGMKLESQVSMDGRWLWQIRSRNRKR